eukprot:EG_transcript_14409
MTGEPAAPQPSGWALPHHGSSPPPSGNPFLGMLKRWTSGAAPKPGLQPIRVADEPTCPPLRVTSTESDPHTPASPGLPDFKRASPLHLSGQSTPTASQANPHVAAGWGKPLPGWSPMGHTTLVSPPPPPPSQPPPEASPAKPASSPPSPVTEGSGGSSSGGGGTFSMHLRQGSDEFVFGKGGGQHFGQVRSNPSSPHGFAASPHGARRRTMSPKMSKLLPRHPSPTVGDGERLTLSKYIVKQNDYRTTPEDSAARSMPRSQTMPAARLPPAPALPKGRSSPSVSQLPQRDPLPRAQTSVPADSVLYPDVPPPAQPIAHSAPQDPHAPAPRPETGPGLGSGGAARSAPPGTDDLWTRGATRSQVHGFWQRPVNVAMPMQPTAQAPVMGTSPPAGPLLIREMERERAA